MKKLAAEEGTAHGYLATGVNDDLTLRMNREAMDHYQLRARRLAGVATPDLKTEVFGVTWDMPIYASAVSSQKAAINAMVAVDPCTLLHAGPSASLVIGDSQFAFRPILIHFPEWRLVGSIDPGVEVWR
jgi:hypothetical protein